MKLVSTLALAVATLLLTAPGLAQVSEDRPAQVELAPAAVGPADVPEPPAVETDLMLVLRGEGEGLTSDAAAARAIETAPSVERARATARQAQAGADRALNGFIPQLTLTAAYTRLSEVQNGQLFDTGGFDPDMIPLIVAGIDDPEARFLWETTLTAQAEQASYTFPVLLNSFSFQASLTYPLSDVIFQVLPAYEGAQSNVRAAEARAAAEREVVALSAREAFYNYARARAAVAVARSALEQAESRRTQIQAFVAAGTAAPVDELRIRAQVAAAQVAVARAEAGVEVGATSLRTLLHLEDSARIAVGEDLLASLPELDANAPRFVAQALRQRDDMRAVRQLIEAAGHQVDAAEGSRYPHVVVAGNFLVANPNQRIFPQTEEFRESWDVSAIVRWSPHDLLNGERNADEARAIRAQARADLRALEDGVRLQVTAAVTSYNSARLALDAARLGIEAAEESYRVQMERFRAGASTVSETIDASAEQVRAQLDLVNAAIDARVAQAQLRRALGRGAQSQ